MKHLLIINILMLLFITNAYSELTQSDLDKIRLIVKDEVSQAIKESEKRMKHYVDAKIQGLDDKFTAQIQGLQGQFNILFWVIIALLPASIALPQLLIWHQNRKNRTK